MLLADSILGHLGIRMAAGDVSQGAHGWLNDLLPTTSVIDSTQQCLGRDEQELVTDKMA